MPRLFIVIMDMIKNKKGLTLVELIVVIAIMAVLAGTIAGVTVSQLDKQKNNNALSEVKILMKNFKNFMLDYEHRGDILSATTAAAAKTAGESAMTAFKNEATSSENVVFVDSLDEAKAGKHMFNTSVSATVSNGKVIVTFTIAAKKVGTIGSDPTVSWDYTE